MKVLICGSQWYDNAPAVAAAGFKELGHEAEIFCDNFKDWRQFSSKVFNRTPFKNLSLRLNDEYRNNVAFKFISLVSESKPDFIFVIGGARFPNTVVKKIRDELHIPIAVFIVDDPSSSLRTLLYDLGAYSEVFVIDKSWMPVMEFFNPGRIYYLPPPGDSLNFKPLGLKRDRDISFGGTMALRLPNSPSGYLRAQILNVLAKNGFKIAAHAGGIKETFREFPALKNVEYVDGYTGHEELNKLYNRSKIVLSINSPQLKHGTAPRVLDIAFTGSFQLAEYKPAVAELFPRGEVKTFRNIKELLDLATFYLEDNEAREKLGRGAREWALEHHSFKSRARTILETCGLKPKIKN